MNDEILDKIKVYVKQAIQDELLIPRPALTYNGQPKPINTAYQRPLRAPKIASGGLYDSVNVYFEGDLEDGKLNLVVDFGAADYWEFVEYGRRPSTKYPPLEIIKQWAAEKPIARFRDRRGRFISNDDRAFLAARSIKEYGIYGIGFLEKATQQVLSRVQQDISEVAANFFGNILLNNRIIFRSDYNRPI